MIYSAAGVFTAAGVFITDGRHVLAGYQPARGAITGFGGKRETGEEPLQTAWRELFEELLGIEAPTSLPNWKLLYSGTYVLYTCSFAELESLLELAIESPFYTSGSPRTIADLLLKRSDGTEITDLALLPLIVANTAEQGGIHEELIADICAWKRRDDCNGDHGK